MPNPPFDGELPDAGPPIAHDQVSSLVGSVANDDVLAGPPGSRPRSRRQSRKSRAKARSKGVRWTRRGLIALGVVLVLIIALVVGGYFYFVYPLHSLTRIDVKNLHHPKPGAPFTVLVTGSDSRSFVKTKGQCKSFGCGSETGGQRSDVIILARVVPATRKIEMLSIPRDTWVTIPGNVQYISGQNRINAAFNTGPALLVQTIEQDFHIPVNYFVAVNFPGLQDMVDSIGGIHLKFKYPVKDVVSGLHVKFAGCQLVGGVQALALVRSRHLQYKEHGVWESDYGSDFTRIRNQQAFFRAVVHQLNSQITNPIAVHDFINAAVHNLTIDESLSTGTMFNLAREFHSFPAGSLKAVTLPTVGPYITSGGADVLLPAAGARPERHPGNSLALELPRRQRRPARLPPRPPAQQRRSRLQRPRLRIGSRTVQAPGRLSPRVQLLRRQLSRRPRSPRSHLPHRARPRFTTMARRRTIRLPAEASSGRHVRIEDFA